jgi:hypothetical protein
MFPQINAVIYTHTHTHKLSRVRRVLFVKLWFDWPQFEILLTLEFFIFYCESSYILSFSHTGMDAQVAYGFHHLRN